MDRNQDFIAFVRTFKTEYLTRERYREKCLLLLEQYRQKGVCVCGGMFFSEGRRCKQIDYLSKSILDTEAYNRAKELWKEKLDNKNA